MVKDSLLLERPQVQRPPFGGGLFFQRTHHSVLGLLRVRHLPVAALSHELVELGLVLCEAETVEEFAELTLLFLEPAQRIRPILIERAVAARRRIVPTTGPWATAHPRAHPVHLALHALHLVLPTVMAAVMSASHTSAPYCEGEHGETDRPPHHEAQHDQSDPGGFAEFIELCGDRHCRPSRECK